MRAQFIHHIALALLLAATFGGFAPCVLAHDLDGVYGAWDLTVESRRGPRPSWVKLFQEGETDVVEFVGSSGGKNRATNVKVDGDSFQWTIDQANYQAKLDNNQLSGDLARGDRRTPFVGQRVVRHATVDGIWDVEVVFAERTIQRVLKFEQMEGQTTGTISGGNGPEIPLRDISLDHDHLSLAIDVERNDRQLTVNYDAVVHGDRMQGTVGIDGTDRTGVLKATRRRNWNAPISLIEETLANWEFQQVAGENQWKIIDGVLVNQDRGWNIFSGQRFQNYKLRLDVNVPPHGNSGIYINGRYEVQVADSYGQETNEGGMGAIYGRAVPTANPSKPAGEWQTFEIRFVDYWVSVDLNGTTIVDNVLIEGITGGALDSHESEPGPLMLQGDHGPMQYRNIVVTTEK